MGTFARGNHDGEQVHVSLRRVHPLTREQYRARRNAIWLSAIHVGFPDILTGELIPVSVSDLAGLWNLDSQTVLNGIASAIADRAAIDAIRVDDPDVDRGINRDWQVDE